MRRIAQLLSLALLSASAAPAFAQSRGVGLGVGAGVAIPDDKQDIAFKPALNWGFFVDIPLISTFHISPSTLVYALDRKGGGSSDLIDESSNHATDVSLSFKFVIPIGPIEPFAGVTAGVTVVDDLRAHVGLLAGLNVNIISNLDIFAQANYRLILADGNNIRDLNIYAGPLFRFY